jgi:co-chaperonin GroES (HSP10)
MKDRLTYEEVSKLLEGVELFHDYVLIYPLGRTDFQSTLLEIPDSANVPNFGFVIATGPGRLSNKRVAIATGVQPGDTILYEYRSTDRVEMGGVSLILIQERFVMGVAEDASCDCDNN